MTVKNQILSRKNYFLLKSVFQTTQTTNQRKIAINKPILVYQKQHFQIVLTILVDLASLGSLIKL